jgi:NTP pyrophosphatase (non-canonical NTP hydrolase)
MNPVCDKCAEYEKLLAICEDIIDRVKKEAGDWRERCTEALQEFQRPLSPREKLAHLLAEEMNEKLNTPRNLQKGDDWKEMGPRQIFQLAANEMDELAYALTTNKPKEEIASEIADVANFLAMLLDKVKSG